jgi:hypothetical protein
LRLGVFDLPTSMSTDGWIGCARNGLHPTTTLAGAGLDFGYIVHVFLNLRAPEVHCLPHRSRSRFVYVTDAGAGVGRPDVGDRYPETAATWHVAQSVARPAGSFRPNRGGIVRLQQDRAHVIGSGNHIYCHRCEAGPAAGLLGKPKRSDHRMVIARHRLPAPASVPRSNR